MLQPVQPVPVLEQQPQLVPEQQLQLVLVLQPLQPPEQFWQHFQQCVLDHMQQPPDDLFLPALSEWLQSEPLAPFNIVQPVVIDVHPLVSQWLPLSL